MRGDCAPPLLLRDVFDDVGEVVELLERNAPYTPLGGWYRPGADPDEATSPLWFQNDWVHADLRVAGSELFLDHPRVLQAARDYYGAQVVLPHSVYVNLMVAIEKSGPAHTDNPRFQGRDRSNTPMWLLRSMYWSGLFDDDAIAQATSIWWLNDVEGGAFRYWPEGPDRPPREHADAMANTSLVGDNHGMFHQVGAVGPFEACPIRVTPRAELAPVEPGAAGGDWSVRDRGEEVLHLPLDRIRVSVLWKADVYQDEWERREKTRRPLSLDDVLARFDRDLEQRGSDLRLDPARIEDPAVIAEMHAVYPEAQPMGRAPAFFEMS